ncbi:NINE protein [Streptococcus pneumoniae]
MSVSLVESFLAANAENLPMKEIPLLRQRMSVLEEEQIQGVVATQMKKPFIALVLCIFFQWLGIHRFYLGQMLAGFTYLLLRVPLFICLFLYVPLVLFSGGSTFVATLIAFLLVAWFLLWTFYDLVTIYWATKQANLDHLNQVMLTIYKSNPVVIVRKED